MAYQDTWIKGRVTEAGDRECAARYEAIASVVGEYQRPVTVWDVGANVGYFGHRLAEQFDGVFVMVDQRPALWSACVENDAKNVVALTRKLTADDLSELAASEHADVTLALNVLHHMDDWPQALEALLSFGDTLLVETPARGDTGSANYQRVGAILDALASVYAQPIATFNSHVTDGVKRTLFRIDGAKRSLWKCYAYGDRVRPRGAVTPRPHRIMSTPTDKTLTFEGEAPRPWVPGINLWNWLQMGGSYPSKLAVKGCVTSAHAGLSGPHGDFKPWNLILQGCAVVPIDAGHRQSVDDRQGLEDTLRWIDRPERAYVRS